ncbi:hypothetical protein PIB30_070969 [Stylosanthes scabra]|uniref:Uncharacterized protein n=1 Tax=Stylosanthes scabra TaxID=79078 RepID=A0ABU6YL75_9FABA|nr:hypothetical protein [Stylosanthes scabra]
MLQVLGLEVSEPRLDQVWNLVQTWPCFGLVGAWCLEDGSRLGHAETWSKCDMLMLDSALPWERGGWVTFWMVEHMRLQRLTPKRGPNVVDGECGRAPLVLEWASFGPCLTWSNCPSLLEGSLVELSLSL